VFVKGWIDVVFVVRKVVLLKLSRENVKMDMRYCLSSSFTILRVFGE
jgi:hypothetical protein